MQPILVRPSPTGLEHMKLSQAENRAAQIAQLHEVPAVVRKLDDVEALENIIENVQRSDLSPIRSWDND